VQGVEVANPSLDQQRAEFLRARASTGTLRLPAWPRQNKDLTEVELEVEWVRFSTLNHRTRAEQRAEITRSGDPQLFSADPLGPAAQSAQYSILKSQEGFEDLKKDLGLRHQQEPAVVTADGVLINGNRRAAALRSLYLDDDLPSARYVKCLVLPEDASPAELVDLETELQIAKDFKQEYGWINEALLIEELYDRENRDFGRVATRMHRDPSDVRSLFEKLQQVHQLVELSKGARLHIDFNENESAFDELSKHIKNKQPHEAESVRSVYFLGTLTDVRYRKLRHLRRPDAAALVRKELELDPSLKLLLGTVDDTAKAGSQPDVLDEVLGEESAAGPLTSLLTLLATKKRDETIPVADGRLLSVDDVFQSIASAITVAAEEANEDDRDQEAQTAPIARAAKAVSEFERALSALPRARTYKGFDESAMAKVVAQLRELTKKYPGSDS
jgi:hypothetical protein